MQRIVLAAVVLGMLGSTGVATAADTPCRTRTATVLIVDPQAPFSARDQARMRSWLNCSAVPTPAVVTVHAGDCEGSAACANVNRYGGDWEEAPGSIWFDPDALDRFGFMHEVGHIRDALAWTDTTRAGLQALLGMPGPWWPEYGTPPAERAADAYAMCSVHRNWPGRWWHRTIRRHRRVVGASVNPTAYDFRAGPRRYRQICRTLQTALQTSGLMWATTTSGDATAADAAAASTASTV